MRFIYSDGVCPENFLKARLKEALELNPQSKAACEILSPDLSTSRAFNILYSRNNELGDMLVIALHFL